MRKKRPLITVLLIALAALVLVSSCAAGMPADGCSANSGTASSDPTSIPQSAGSSSEPSGHDPITPSPSSLNTSAPDPTSTVEPEAGPILEIVFLDVGEGDAALLICDGHAALIDGGSAGKSSFIYSYLKNRSLDHLDYVFATHSDEDHIGGLAGALNYATAGKVYCSVDSGDTKAFSSFKKYVEKQGNSIIVPSKGDVLDLGPVKIQILGPINRSDEDNNNSLVLRAEYNETSFLFTGDMQREEEQDLLDSGCTLKSTVLKVGHHGSRNSTSYPFLREVSPDFAVISVGSNPYGHPTEDVLTKLRDADVEVFRTDLQGNITCLSNGRTVEFSVERNRDADTVGTRSGTETDPTTSPGEDEVTYILNKNSHIFHYPWCSSVGQMRESNKICFTGTRDEAIDMGYHPCQRCNP